MHVTSAFTTELPMSTLSAIDYYLNNAKAQKTLRIHLQNYVFKFLDSAERCEYIYIIDIVIASVSASTDNLHKAYSETE